MVVATETDEIVEQRRTLLDLLLSDHRGDCIVCEQAGGCRLQELAYRYQVPHTHLRGRQARVPRARRHPVHRLRPLEVHPLRPLRRGLRAGPAVPRPRRGRAGLRRRRHDLVRTVHGRDRVRALRQLRLGLPDRRPSGQARPAPGAHLGHDAGRHDLHLLRLRLQGRAAGRGRAHRPGDLRRSARVPGRATSASRAATRFQFVGHPDRLDDSRSCAGTASSCPATWDEALDEVARRLGEVRDAHGADAVAGFSSARCTNEENYLIQKFARR